MNKIIGVRFRGDGTVSHFDSGHFVLHKGDKVLVETAQGPAYGVVYENPKAGDGKPPNVALRKILRVANKKDQERFEKNSRMEKDVFAFCYERVQERSLPMCLVTVERVFNGSRVIVYFTADGRVDFRELIKDLVQKFHTRIEMRQIGVRHQAKMVGGLGCCGRQLCCSSFLSTFDPVSIKMAKAQSLSLNPAKISGMCGRLMCCLNYEHEFYKNAKKNIPKIGKKVKTTQGDGKVIRHNIFRETLTITLESGEEVDVPYKDIVENAG